MAKDRTLVRASDLGSWTFCNRAWWLARVQGIEHRNPAVLARGKEHHAAVGKTVQATNRNARLGMMLLLGGGALGLLTLLLWLLS